MIRTASDVTASDRTVRFARCGCVTVVLLWLVGCSPAPTAEEQVSDAGKELGRAIYELSYNDLDRAQEHLNRARQLDPDHGALQPVGSRIDRERAAQAALRKVTRARDVGDLPKAQTLLAKVQEGTRAFDLGRSEHRDLATLTPRFEALRERTNHEAAKSVFAQLDRRGRFRIDLHAFGPRQALATAVPQGRFITGSCFEDVVCKPFLAYQGRPDALASPEQDLPQSIQNVDHSYYIDVVEVSTDDFQACLDAGVCEASTVRPHAADERCNLGDTARGKHPVNCVSLSGAQAYCAWAGGRLPDEFEWERAARWEDGRRFPWGDRLPGCILPLGHFQVDGATCEAPTTTAASGSYPDGLSPLGLLDVAGNVAEWTRTPINGEAPGGNAMGHVTRGGGFMSSIASVRVAARSALPPSTQHPAVGFRCAYSYFDKD